MSKQPILFIVRSFQHPAPQPIRFQKITSFLKDDYDIHILMLHYGNSEEIQIDEGLTIHKLPYSKIGKWINKESTSKNDSSTAKGGKRKTSLIQMFLSKIKVRSLVFPDPLIFEIKRLRKKLQELLVKYNYDIIVGSSYPHTTLILSAKAKRIKPNLRWIHDIGDPFYSPKNGYRFRAFFSYLYESYYCKNVDCLVVTNQATKKYYVERYKHYNDTNVQIVTQGADIEPQTVTPKSITFPLKMIYAGTFYDRLREPFALYEAVALNSKTISLDLHGRIAIKHLPNKSISNISFFGPTPHKTILEKYKNCDVVLFIDNAYGLQTPGKVFEVIAIQKPILCIYQNEESASIDIFRKIPYAFITKNNVDSINETLNKIFDSLKDNSILFKYDLNNFSWKNRASEFKNILEN